MCKYFFLHYMVAAVLIGDDDPIKWEIVFNNLAVQRVIIKPVGGGSKMKVLSPCPHNVQDFVS